MSYVYLERFLKATNGSFPLRWYNWTCLMIICILLASKVWDDLSMWNIDYTKICTFLTIQRLNQLESVYLIAMNFDVRIAQKAYAEYYFKIKSMLGVCDLPTDNEFITRKPEEGMQLTKIKGEIIGARCDSDSKVALKVRKNSGIKASLEEIIKNND